MSRKGFTLIEGMIVAAILMIIATLCVPLFIHAKLESKNGTFQCTLTDNSRVEGEFHKATLKGDVWTIVDRKGKTTKLPPKSVCTVKRDSLDGLSEVAQEETEEKAEDQTVEDDDDEFGSQDDEF